MVWIQTQATAFGDDSPCGSPAQHAELSGHLLQTFLYTVCETDLAKKLQVIVEKSWLSTCFIKHGLNLIL